jgi:thiol-disulfide isomerase/thioredoxin
MSALVIARGAACAPAAETDQQAIDLWFFWSSTCPHCQVAHPVVDALDSELPWLTLHSLRLDGNRENVAFYRTKAAELGEEARSVPAFIFCGRMVVGWDIAGSTEQALRSGLADCRKGTAPGKTDGSIVLPFLGEVDHSAYSLPTFTVVLAALDSFNPCAFFVLLFLLSFMIHAGSRGRMLLVGCVFVLISGLVYFLAMAAWFNLFALVGHLSVVTLLAGALAVWIGSLNIKDYFWLKRGASLSISDRHRNNLVVRMRGLVSSRSLTTMLAATVSLAVLANLYELLCTAGFPMVYTRLLTMNALSSAEYYAYLVFYNVIYVIPLLAIVIAFALTLGRRKLQEREGRVLKLLSGTMMLGLGLILLLSPERLNSIWTALLIPLVAIAVTALIVKSLPRG